MSTIDAVTSGTSGANATTKTAAQESEDRFLKLLVTQMKNQDPLNPLDNAQVTSQMAQLSTVSGIDKLNTTLQAMSSSFAASQSLQAAGMIGHSVLAPGSSTLLQNGAAVGGFNLALSADHAVVTIKDAAGNALHSMDMGVQQAGNVMFQWDGVTDSGAAAASGTYTFAVSATQGGQKVDATTLALGTVSSVSLGISGVTLNTDVLGSVDAATVKQIF
ncbi:MAG: flagellar biosynthesis protein FlgD [Betaproteobacteria bacterium CG2_30_59_46]|nr:MAG: flagellar biosynthesis protein FlgD [Betaproteobacteria bacterium CG2_30_59_46]PIQ12955.1 MAG: flagellar biosynthesis protein FlgD [Hydrogenophilales bacterium CG18_big_fil_WC_8_21_14_2_50_58_12]PIX99703.1 MAG: flagellar biosynthesis protein FlgD [Hydrogenophilales bacterium CG_4_10_14_3_um_filter_58_23]PJB07180.1 MAG: flagellar biosynthesis protein FlgD [Hydrogenophilales bacterium CG_4_9_14_3_um_filter_59_35]